MTFKNGTAKNSTTNGTNGTNGHPNSHANGHKNGHVNGRPEGSHLPPSPIAICGLAMRLPGGIRNASDFWDLLKNGRDARDNVPLSRYNATGFDDTLGKKGAIKTKYGYFLDEDLTSLDTSFFSLTKTELERTDPQQRQILEVTRECFENAGEADYRGKLIGCYVGTFGEDWLQMSAKENQHSGGYLMTGHGDLMIANRVSYEYDLQGPSMVIKTGCSASLVGLHEACRALQSRDCNGAIVAGTNMIMGPTTTAAMTAEGILSPDGSCKTFDASADGFARGEAITAVYIKRLEDAIRDNNPIRAIIRNTGTNSDGKSPSLMQPHGKAHEALMRKVYGDAGLDPRDTAFVECHGTGTPTGDPIETTAVGNVFGERGVYIGSVKPNVGHSEGASGITSLIKAVLALEHNTIPPNIKFNNPNPKIPFAEKGLMVPVKATPWPEDRQYRISINSFGIGGANAHVILDSAERVRPKAPHSPSESPQLLVLSANTRDSLKENVKNYQEYLQKHPERLADVVYTTGQHREHLPQRTFSVATSGVIGEFAPFSKTPAKSPEVVMIFSGQGAQWPQMAKDLIETNPDFREDIVAMDDLLQTLDYPPSWSIQSELTKSAKISRMADAELAQPLCTAIQIALFNAFARCGIHPSAVVGHSSGEIAAAYASGAISVTEALLAAYYRGYVTKHQDLVGGMAALGLGADDASAYLVAGVVVACENSPSSTTISGDLDRLQEVLAKIKEEKPDVLARELKVNMAYHSHHMKSLGPRYRTLLIDEITKRKLRRSNPKVPLFSTVTNEVISQGSELGPDYWVGNLTSPVRFSTAVSNLLAHQQNNVFLEIGPHSTLAGPLRQICSEAGSNYLYVSAMLRNKSCQESIQSAFGQLYQHGLPVDLRQLNPVGNVLTDLPTYSWEHKASYWYEARVSQDWRFRKFGHHSLLGLRVHESTGLEPSWRNVMNLEDEPWIADHKIREDIVFPFAGYIAMAGEAVRQISGVETGYSLRHTIAHTALVLNYSKPVEMVTTLRPRRITDSADSEWFDFVICSYSGSNWIKNCEGQVRSRGRDLPAVSEIETLPRKVAPSKWYDTMADIGLVYGPEFQRLTHITSSTTENLAIGEITSPQTHQDAPFLFHPASIDASLQLLLVALAKGLGRGFGQLCVPTIIEELEISRGASKMDVKAWSSPERKSLGIDCSVDGKAVFRLRGLQLTPMDDEKTSTTIDRQAAARLEWCPDFDFMDISKLFIPPNTDPVETRLLEEMTLLCMLDSAERLKGLATKQPHFIKFRDWLHMEIGRAKNGTYPLLKNSKALVKLSPSARLDMINDRFKQLASTSKWAIAEGLKRIRENSEDIFTGKGDTLDILMQDDILSRFYDATSFGHGPFVRMLSHSKPMLRILEVGGGTGGTTETFLRDLVDAGGYPMYSLYSFTDISAGFFPQAKERFAYAANMDYKVFDISKSPFEQGFEPESYDLILAPNVVHATASLFESLSNLRVLLKPNGHLVLTELCAVIRTPNYIFGNFSGWWLGEENGRPYEPYISVERWDQELKAAGFSGVVAARKDAEEPYQYCAAIVSQPASSKAEPVAKKTVTLLCDDPNNGVGWKVLHGLEESGFSVSVCKLGQRPPKGKNIISALDLESYFFQSITEERFNHFQDIIRNMLQEKILWLTRPAQMNCKDPRSAQTVGMARAIRCELGLPFITLEIDPVEAKFPELVMQVFNKVLNTDDTEYLNPDREFVVDNGVIKLGRYHPFSLTEEVSGRGTATSSPVKSLHIEKLGQLQTLTWKEGPAVSEIDEDEVEIESRAVGLNFKDVVMAMGILESGPEGPELGLEVAGLVKRVGKSVQNVAVGDRVVALAPHGCITTNAILPAALCVRIAAEMSFEEAATMPICFATAIKSLLELGQLEKGQSVLVHSATGGVGHAAIQICKMIGAEIFATVGTESKTQYLIDTFGIPRNHIFNSRDASFLPELMRETNTRGVDLVLNSLSGELLHASWKCVARFGKMIEIGKRDLAGFGQLNLNPFLDNRSYCAVDILQLVQEKPEMMGRCLTQCVEMVQQGKIHPLRPMTTFKTTKVEEAFRSLQKGDHIGKVVISMPESASEISATPAAPMLSLDPEASYLLTGGLGGLGKAVAVWLVEHGARSLIFLSRSAGKSTEDQLFFAELESLGCLVFAIAGKVEDKGALRAAIVKTPRPIKGVVHFAMVLKDASITEMTHSNWQSAISPKVDGAWNIHDAFSSQPLDFLILASSTVTIVDNPGQGNYNAANTFLEAFCQYRHSLGLPASVLNICPIEDVGFVAETPAARKLLKTQGNYFLREADFLDYMGLSIFNSLSSPAQGEVKNEYAPWMNPAHLVMGLRSEIHLDDPANRCNWKRDRRMGTYHNIHTQITSDTSSDSDELKTFLARGADEPDLLTQKSSMDFLAKVIGRKIFSFMLKPEEEVEIGLSLTQIGLDSLMAIELRRWWAQAFGAQISVLEIMATGTLEALGRVAAEGVVKKFKGTEGEGEGV